MADNRKNRKIRSSQRQKQKQRLMIITGASIALLTVILIIYFQFFSNEVIKANEVNSLTVSELPADLVVPDKITINNDTLSRNGMNYKVAKPLPKDASFNQ